MIFAAKEQDESNDFGDHDNDLDDDDNGDDSGDGIVVDDDDGDDDDCLVVVCRKTLCSEHACVE